MKKIVAYTFFLLLFGSVSWAQQIRLKQAVVGKNDTIIVPITIENGEVMPWILLPEFTVFGQRKFKTPQDRSNYERLKYNVLKVMPYAILAKNRYVKLERDLAVTANKKEQKKLIKACDQEIKQLFDTQVKDLTIAQGQILTKLINRELNKTTFEILKETQGGMKAFLYQNIARVFGHNLKSEYNPLIDREIENIIRNSAYANE